MICRPKARSTIGIGGAILICGMGPPGRVELIQILKGQGCLDFEAGKYGSPYPGG
jgi:hypothetical protein